MDNAVRVMDRRLDQEHTNPSSSSLSSSSSSSTYSPDLPSQLHDSLSSPSSILPSLPTPRSNSQDHDQDNRSNSDQLATSNIQPFLDRTSTPASTSKLYFNSMDNHLTTNSSTNINYITHNTPNYHNHNHNTHSINQQEFTPAEMREGVDTAVLGSGTKTVLEPESAPFQSFQSFFSPQQSTHIGFEQMSMDNHPLSSTTGNIQSSVNDPRANLLISPRPRYTTRSFRGPNSEALSMGAIIDANHSASSLDRGIGSPANNPSALGTISSIVNSTSEANSEDMEKERLDYQIKGRSHVSIGYSGGLDADRWTTTTAKGNQHSLGMENIPDDRSNRVTGRHSISKPKMSTSPAATNSSAAISGSSEMLPLSEFLSQTADSDKPSTPSTEGLSRRTDDTELNYPMYSSFPTPPPPGFPGRVPITSASGEFSGFQQFPSIHKDIKYSSDRSGVSTQALAGVLSSSHSHETHPSGTDSCVAQDHDENDYLNQRKPLRNYKIFPGRNVFFCGGRIMTSHDFPAFILAVMLVLVPTGLFHGFTSPYLWHRLSPAAPIVQAYVFIVAFSSMLKTSWTDPGVIPRGIDGDPPVDPPIERDPSTASYYPPQGQPRLKEVQIGIYTVRLKYCDTCKIYRPPRCSHCRQCDNCVEDEDHHCIWLNNCIGRRNYRYFLIFVTTMSIYAFLTFALSLTQLLLLYHDKRNSAVNPESVSFSKDAMAKAPVAVLVMLYSMIMGLAVGSLAGYHFWLATKNRTTHEQLTASMMRPHVVDNPFDRGNIFRNCAAVLCRPPTRSYIRRRDYTVA